MKNINIVVRPYQEQDEEQVIELWHNCGLVVPWNHPRKDIWLKLQVQPELFLIGLVETQVIATIMAGYEGHRGWLNYLAIAPEYQRQGIGQYMVEQVITKLKAMNCPKINLQIRTFNTSVIKFYECLGFKIDDVVSMGKRL
ncbi:GNAT family acetyltransferase [Chlorogloeopsis sp. ULAP01]|uniref:GNAT family acetyltransferase n=1 Tax=Chlorogloeopsis sp. ULAP01 TaxID=3056483 RepID=UPI0025AB2A06|nr:GNAT family acetyltransferase [Chlorogloeopsis sp. ULAP01]MDM9384013.1 GNAT family acetyltransferase [Chlorogloeopsis sp. ULAP01]